MYEPPNKRIKLEGNINEQQEKQLNENLCDAAKKGDLEEVRKLIEAGANWDAKDKDGKKALYYAVKHGHLEIVKYRLEDVEDINLLLDQGFYWSNKGIEDDELDSDFDEDSDYDERKDTLLHVAAEYGNQEIVEYFLDRGVSIESKGNFEKTILHDAAAKPDNEEMIKFLLSRGADIDAQNSFEATPLHYAARHSYTGKNVRVLIDNGADITLFHDNDPPISAAVEYDNIEAVELLLKKAKEINMEIEHLYHALSVAAQCKNEDIFPFLLQKTDTDTALNWLIEHKGNYHIGNDALKFIVKYILLRNPEAEKPDYITNNPELSEYWDSQVRKEIFLLNNKGIFDQMLDSKYVINRDYSLDKLTSDAENFLKETQEKLGIVIDRAEFIEYRVKKRYPASLKALTFGNVPFECYEELSGGILDDPNVEQSKIGKAIG